MGRGGGLFEVFFFPGRELLLFGSGSPLIISLESPLQGKIAFIRPCININKKIVFSLFLWNNYISHNSIVKQPFWRKYYFQGSQPTWKITEIPGGGGMTHPSLEWKFQGGDLMQKCPIFWNYTLQHLRYGINLLWVTEPPLPLAKRNNHSRVNYKFFSSDITHTLNRRKAANNTLIDNFFSDKVN